MDDSITIDSNLAGNKAGQSHLVSHFSHEEKAINKAKAAINKLLFFILFFYVDTNKLRIASFKNVAGTEG